MPAGLRGRRRHHHRLVRQGPDAARRRRRSRMYDPMKDRQIGIPEVIEKWGVPPEKMIDLQAMTGDSVDNVPGVPGIGPKTAAQLARTVRRPRYAARPRRRDQAGKTPANDHRQCRQGAHLARAGQAEERRAVDRRARRPRAAAARRPETHRLPEDDGVHHADAPRRRGDRDRCGEIAPAVCRRRH